MCKFDNLHICQSKLELHIKPGCLQSKYLYLLLNPQADHNLCKYNHCRKPWQDYVEYFGAGNFGNLKLTPTKFYGYPVCETTPTPLVSTNKLTLKQPCMILYELIEYHISIIKFSGSSKSTGNWLNELNYNLY